MKLFEEPTAKPPSKEAIEGRRNLFTPEMRRKFEETLAPTLALSTEKSKGDYVSPKTANCFISFCYGWLKGEGECQPLRIGATVPDEHREDLPSVPKT